MIISELSKELNESVMQCPECGGAAYSDAVLAEKQDACYHKVRSRYKVWPSAYASGALVQCRKKGAANWGNKSKKESVAEGLSKQFEIIYLDQSGERKRKIVSGTSKESVARQFKKQYKLEIEQVKQLQQGVAEAELDEGQYEMMMRNGQVKKFIAKDDADAKRIAAGHGAKSVIRLRGGVPAGKIAEQGVAEGLSEMDKSAPQPGRDGRVSHSTYGSRDKKGSDYFKDKEAPGKAITAKQASKDALDILKKQGVAEEQLDEKCWDTHRQAGMKRKGGRMVPNCVPKESASPMIKPPTNRFDTKAEAFAYAKEHGGRVFQRVYTDPNTGMQHKSFVVKSAVDEAIKLDAPQRRMGRDELQSYADRIKTGTKTKQDKFAPIIHGSNIKAITKDDNNTEWDLDDLAKQITTRPKAILGTNAKMEKSKTEGEIIYDLTLPALSGIVVDEENGDFVEITTCPGAGECQLFCYARKGGYVMFPASSMSAAQALNFLVNDPDGYMARVNQEIKTIKGKTDRAGVQLVVRWHDAGDFFSKQYLDLAYNVAESNPDVKFYAYTKMADVATGDKPKNFIINFSSGSKRGQEKKVEIHKAAGNVVKQGVTVPKDMFFDLIARDGNKLIKDAKGRTQFKDAAALNTFKDRLAQKYQVDPNSIITYDEMLRIPEGPKPKWNVIVQPGAGDRAANRIDVIDSYLMFH